MFLSLKRVYCQPQNFFLICHCCKSSVKICAFIFPISHLLNSFSLLSFYCSIYVIKLTSIIAGKFHNPQKWIKNTSFFSGSAKSPIIYVLSQTRPANLATEAAVKMEMQSQKELSALWIEASWHYLTFILNYQVQASCLHWAALQTTSHKWVDSGQPWWCK